MQCRAVQQRQRQRQVKSRRMSTAWHVFVSPNYAQPGSRRVSESRVEDLFRLHGRSLFLFQFIFHYARGDFSFSIGTAQWLARPGPVQPSHRLILSS